MDLLVLVLFICAAVTFFVGAFLIQAKIQFCIALGLFLCALAWTFEHAQPFVK